MKLRNTVSPLALLILAALVVTISPPAAATFADRGPSASGAGQFRFRDPSTAQLELWNFSFEARANKNGRATGRAHFENVDAQTQVVVRINCLAIFDSIFAVMSGRVLHSNDPNLPKATIVVFQASDGQLLTVPGIDTMTPPFQSFGDCQDGQPLTMLPVENGNVTIEP